MRALDTSVPHSPVAKLNHISLVTTDKWQAFLAVDALQCLGVTLALLQLFALGARTRVQFLILTLITCVTVVALTPAVWRANWEAVLPVALAAYMTPHGGSLFPVFPWSAYSLLGAAVGAVDVGANHVGSFSMRVLGAGGVAMVGEPRLTNIANSECFMRFLSRNRRSRAAPGTG